MITKVMRLFGLAFIFVIVAGITLQFVALPMSSFHAGNGLMTGGDWVGFHQLAVALADEIRSGGWSRWVPRVDGQAPASVAAFFYVVTGVDEPWVLLPLHGVLYGLAAGGLYSIARAVGASQRLAYLVTLPLFLFPSTAQIWGQIHKDIYSLAGIILILNFWTKIFILYTKKYNRKWIIFDIFLLLIGSILVVFVRPYLDAVVLLASVLAVAIILLSSLPLPILRSSCLRSLRGHAFCLSVVLGALILQASISTGARMLSAAETEGGGATGVPLPICHDWVQVRILPPVIDSQARGVACVRDAFLVLHPNAGSNIDHEVRFTDATDILIYAPRALQIGLFAPFPTQWFPRAAQQEARIMRILVIPEMIVFYVALLGILVALARPRLRLPTLIAVAFSITIITIYALSIPNVGTLYRMRYPAMFILIAFGFLGWASFIKHVGPRYSQRCAAIAGFATMIGLLVLTEPMQG